MISIRRFALGVGFVALSLWSRVPLASAQPFIPDGPDVPTGLRLSLLRTGPYSFRLVQKLNGSTVSSSVYTVAEDGKTMTEVGGTPGDPPSTVVWEK